MNKHHHKQKEVDTLDTLDTLDTRFIDTDYFFLFITFRITRTFPLFSLIFIKNQLTGCPPCPPCPAEAARYETPLQLRSDKRE